MGNLFHQSLDTFFRNVRDHGKDFRTITDAERRALVKRAVEEVSAKYRNTIMKSSARNAYLEKKVERITDRTVRALIYQIRKGDFQPEAFEVDVSTRIPLKDGEAVNLRGRIDRMDVFEDEDKIYVKIMDYKSGSTSFDHSLFVPWAAAPACGLHGRGVKAPGEPASGETGGSGGNLLLPYR